MISHRRIVLAFAPCLLLLEAGCATMIHGTTQRITILTTNAATVAVDGVPVGSGPAHPQVSRDRSHLLTITKDSAPPVEMQLKRSLSPWVYANAFVYYLPALIDFADGAAYNFKTDEIHVVFPSDASSAAMRRAGLAVNQQIRFTTRVSGTRMTGLVDSATTDRLFVRTAPWYQSTHFTVPTSVAMRDVRWIDVQTADDRWAPAAARALGSPLLVDDALRVRTAARGPSIEGQLVTMDSQSIVLSTSARVMRVDRSAIASLERKQDHDYAEGARRGLMAGAIVGGLIATGRKGNLLTPDGPSLMRGNVIGAAVGLTLTSILAPGKWVDLRVW